MRFLYSTFFRSISLGVDRLHNLFQKKIHKIVLFIPFVWLSIFYLLPFLFILQISFSKAVIASPPYMSMFEWIDSALLKIQINFLTYINLFTNDLYISTFLSSVTIASISAVGCLVVGYMMAYGIARAPQRYKTILILLVVLPFWTSFLIRIYACMSLLSVSGMINKMLIFLGIVSEPILMLDNSYAVCIGIIYCYLPFMVLPIYNVLEKIDYTLIEASFDLGATPWKTFWSITFPLSFNGIMAGTILVFVPALGEFVIPELLGGPDTLMIGRTLWLEFFNNRDWPQACALAVSMIVMIVAPLMFYQSKQSKQSSKHTIV